MFTCSMVFRGLTEARTKLSGVVPQFEGAGIPIVSLYLNSLVSVDIVPRG